jgi:hypothetical protein
MRMELLSTRERLHAHGFDPAYSVFLADFANAMLEQGHPREAASFINARLAGDAKVLAHPKRSIT